MGFGLAGLLSLWWWRRFLRQPEAREHVKERFVIVVRWSRTTLLYDFYFTVAADAKSVNAIRHVAVPAPVWGRSAWSMDRREAGAGLLRCWRIKAQA